MNIIAMILWLIVIVLLIVKRNQYKMIPIGMQNNINMQKERKSIYLLNEKLKHYVYINSV